MAGSSGEYEEHWSITRLTVALVLILAFIGAWSLASTSIRLKSEADLLSAQCAAASEKEVTHLLAISTGQLALCDASPRPHHCRAEITKDLDSCLSLPESYTKKLCQFSVTKEPSLCPDDPAWCQAITSTSESACQQLPSSLAMECVAVHRKDPSLLGDALQNSCKDKAWELVSSAHKNSYLCWMIEDAQIQDLCIEKLS